MGFYEFTILCSCLRPEYGIQSLPGPPKYVRSWPKSSTAAKRPLFCILRGLGKGLLDGSSCGVAGASSAWGDVEVGNVTGGAWESCDSFRSVVLQRGLKVTRLG